MKLVGTFLFYESKFVIVLRHPHKPNGNKWGLPAGKIEEGETTDEAAVRELFEETGYRVQPDELIHLGDFSFGQENPYIFATYRVDLDALHEVKLEESAHAEYRWVTPEECDALPNLVPDFHELLRTTRFIK